MYTFFKSILLIFTLVFTLSCQNPMTHNEEHHNTSVAQSHEAVLDGHVLTAADQAQLTADIVLSILREGNERFIHNELTPRDYPLQVEHSINGQYPMAVILSCIDSRVPVEQVFDLGIGDVFVHRVAGNIVNQDVLAGMEYACKVSGSKLVLVLGHESCGAVKAAIDQVELGNITSLLDKIQPAIEDAQTFEGDKTSSNKAFVHYVNELNISEAIKQIRSESPILAEMEQQGEIKIVGAYYDMHTGKVAFLEE